MPGRLAGGLPEYSFNEADLEEQTEGFAAHAPKKVEIPKATLIHKIHGPTQVQAQATLSHYAAHASFVSTW